MSDKRDASNAIDNCDKFCIKSESLNNNEDVLQFDEVPYSSVGTNSISNEENEEAKKQSPSRDSGVFFDNDVFTSTTSTSRFLWMPPVTPFYPSHPLPLHSAPPITGLTGFWNLSPTAGLAGFWNLLPATNVTGFDSVQSRTGLTGFDRVAPITGLTGFGNVPPLTRSYSCQEPYSLECIMFNHNVSDFRPRAMTITDVTTRT